MMKSGKLAFPVIVCLSLLFLAGCQGEAEKPPQPPHVAPSAADIAGQIQFLDAQEKPLNKLKPEEYGYKLYDSSEREIARLKVERDRVKVQDRDGKPLFKVEMKAKGCKVYDASEKEIARIKVILRGEIEMEDSRGNRIAKWKPKEKGYELRDPKGGTIAKSKSRRGKIVLDAEDGTPLYSVKGMEDAMAGSFFALKALPIEERAGLSVFYFKIAQ